MPMSPKDYLTPNPTNDIFSNIGAMMQIKNMQQQKEMNQSALETAAMQRQQMQQQMGQSATTFDQQNTLFQQQQLAYQRSEKMRKDLLDITTKMYSDPNLTYAKTKSWIAKIPELAQPIQAMYDGLDAARKDQTKKDTLTIDSLVTLGKFDDATKYLTDLANASISSGDDKQGAVYKALAETIKADPKASKLTSNILLSSALTPKEYDEHQQHLATLQKTQEETIKTQEQIKGEQAKTLQTKQATVSKQYEDAQKKEEAYKTAQKELDDISSTLTTLKQVKYHPAGRGATGASTYVPDWMLGGDIRNARALIEELKNKVYMIKRAELKGQGSVSIDEADKAAASFVNFDIRQTDDEFLKQLNKAQYYLEKMESRAKTSLRKAMEVRPGSYATAATTPTKPSYKEGDTATGAGGAKMIFRNGKWEPLK